MTIVAAMSVLLVVLGALGAIWAALASFSAYRHEQAVLDDLARGLERMRLDLRRDFPRVEYEEPTADALDYRRPIAPVVFERRDGSDFAPRKAGPVDTTIVTGPGFAGVSRRPPLPPMRDAPPPSKVER